MGFIVGLSGIDGSGKTTVAMMVVEKLRQRGEKVTYHHELDFMLLVPMFRFFSRLVGGRQAENVKDNFLSGSNQSRRIYADLYYFIVWLDNLIGYAYFKLKRGVIIHDRWPYDILAIFEWRQYRNRLIEKLLGSFPRPDALLLLTVPAEVAMERKKSDPHEWHQTLDFYQTIERRISDMARKFRYDGVIDATAPPEEVAGRILALVAGLR
ncbi:MAG: thymidylate kinase [Chloroflexi bacterium]|nr:thymidylate kinase [Chloroflexota bacterium]